MSLAHHIIREPAEAPSMLLVEEISHRVLNEYTEAVCALDRVAAGAADPGSVEAIKIVQARLLACSAAHQVLQAPIDDGLRDLSDHLARVGGRLAIAELEPRGIQLTVDAEEVLLPAHSCWVVGLIVAELLRNAARHGLGGGPGEIRLYLARWFGSVRCTVRDNGRRGDGQGVGRGRRLVERLAERLHGRVEWTFTPVGCCARLEFPAAPAERPLVSGPCVRVQRPSALHASSQGDEHDFPR